jgi:hypothetical protein
MRLIKILLISFSILFLLPLGTHAVYWRLQGWAPSWNSADWSSSGLLKDASAQSEAQVLFLAARVGRWRGIFAEHCWVVVKDKNGAWERYDVMGWGTPVRFNGQPPDGRWYGNDPRIFAKSEGMEAERLIPRIRGAVKSYPWQARGTYRVWPGPNSNTFIRHVASAVPEMEIVLPNTAIGRSVRTDGSVAGLTPSRTGIEWSAWGYAGMSIGMKEGLEIDVLSAVFGIDFVRPAIKLPGWGRIGFSDAP